METFNHKGFQQSFGPAKDDWWVVDLSTAVRICMEYLMSTKGTYRIERNKHCNILKYIYKYYSPYVQTTSVHALIEQFCMVMCMCIYMCINK